MVTLLMETSRTDGASRAGAQSTAAAECARRTRTWSPENITVNQGNAMNTHIESRMLDLLRDLAAYPEWDSREWVEAVQIAIREAIKEVKDTDHDLARKLSLAEVAADPPDRERALNAALEEWESRESDLASLAVRPRSIRDWLRRTTKQVGI